MESDAEYARDLTMSAYILHMTCECGGSETIPLESTSLDKARQEAAESCRSWLQEGEWGDEGASVSGGWELLDEGGETLLDDDGDAVCGSVSVDVEPNHGALIVRACGGLHTDEWERCCGDGPDDHDWTSEGEGGCTENPGVWSTGGTSMLFTSHCRACGLRRRERWCGSQRNPGEHDTVEYAMPERWCAECESEECECETEE